MKFLEHLLQEGLAKKRPRQVPGLTPREVEVMMNLMAKALVASYADQWKDDRDDLDHPLDLIEDGIMQQADGILDMNYAMLWKMVKEQVENFR